MAKPKQKQQRKVSSGPADDAKKAAEIAEIAQKSAEIAQNPRAWPAYTVERKPMGWLKPSARRRRAAQQ
jgi:hypothetical protein